MTQKSKRLHKRILDPNALGTVTYMRVSDVYAYCVAIELAGFPEVTNQLPTSI